MRVDPKLPNKPTRRRPVKKPVNSSPYLRLAQRRAHRTLLACVQALTMASTGVVLAEPLLSNSVVASNIDGNSQLPVAELTAPEFTQLLRDLAPLPVLTLGLVGLIWIRKHSAQL